MEAPIVLPSGHQIREGEEDKAMRETSVSSSSYFATKLEPLTFSITDVSFLACGVVVLIATSTAPAWKIPSAATTHSAQLGAQMATASPTSIPETMRAAATPRLASLAHRTRAGCHHR